MRRALAGGLELDDDPARIDIDAVHAFISERVLLGPRTPARTREPVRSPALTACSGCMTNMRQVGFARAVSDGVIVAYLADVYVLEPYRGRGLGLELVREMMLSGAPGSTGALVAAHRRRPGSIRKARISSKDSSPYELMELRSARTSDEPPQ